MRERKLPTNPGFSAYYNAFSAVDALFRIPTFISFLQNSTMKNNKVGPKGSTAAFMTIILTDLMPTADNESKITFRLLWKSDVTPTSIRRGSTWIMVREVHLRAVVAETGHDMKGSRESSGWECIDGDDVLRGHGSAALSGWSRPLDPFYPPQKLLSHRLRGFDTYWGSDVPGTVFLEMETLYQDRLDYRRRRSWLLSLILGRKIYRPWILKALYLYLPTLVTN